MGTEATESCKRKLIVMGNGMAGARTVEEILARAGAGQFDITIFGEEPYGNYNRILLSNVLNGSQDASEIFLNGISWYEENGIHLHAGARVDVIARPFLNSSSKEHAPWVALGSVDQIGLGQGRCFSIGGRRLAVFRARGGNVYALDASCPHRNGPLAEGMVGGGVVICPFHGYKFSLSDGHGLDSEFSVGCYPARIQDGRIYVKLERLR